jgi:uncharacterized Zn-binding protein involved in type VI secretion
MSLAAKIADKGTQHDGYNETVITAGSPTVSIDGLPAARLGSLNSSCQTSPPTSPA